MTHAKDIYRAALSADVLLYLKNGELAYKASDVGVPDKLRQLIVEHKAKIIEYLLAEEARSSGRHSTLPAITPLVDRSNLPLSRAQRRVWFADQKANDGSLFNIQGCFAFDGALSDESFERSVLHLVRRHEVLRTNFFEEAGDIHTAVQDYSDAPLTIVDMSMHAQSQQAEIVKSIVEGDLHKRFDLARDTLLRVNLLRLSADRHIAIFNMHHIVSDGWSVGLLIEEFCRAYTAYASGDRIADQPDPLQYADFAAWQETYLQGEVLKSGLAFWKSYLEELPELHSLPIDRERLAQQSFNGDVFRTSVGQDLEKKIRAYCQDRKVTLFMFLETALSLVLSMYGSKSDIAIGTPVAGRSVPECESVVGLFINTVVIRNQVDLTKSFDDLLRENRANILSAFSHQHIPFELVVEELGHRRSLSYSPLFQIWFVLQNNETVELSLPGCNVKEYTDLPAPAAKYELNLYATEVDGDIHLEWVFNTDIFEGRSVHYVAQEFLLLLERIVDAPEKDCIFHNIFSARGVCPEIEPKPKSVEELSCNDAILPRRIMEQMVKHESSEAVATDEGSFSYGDLNQLSEGYATAIRRSGTSARVGLLMETGVNVVAVMLAALKSQRTYVTLDPGYPQARLKYMVEHSGCDLIICDETQREVAQSLTSDILIIDGRDAAAVDIHQSAEPDESNPEAYILYTSGSTGNPKGVVQSRANLAYHAGSYVDALDLSHQDKILQLASYSFDASVLDTYGALLVGASLHLTDLKTIGKKRLLRLIEENGISVYHSTPSVFKYLFSDAPPQISGGVRIVVLGGEPVDLLCTQIFRRVFGDECRLIGLYGATESTLTALAEITAADIDAQLRPGLGMPIKGTDIAVLRENGELARVFEVGQIVIRSEHLARGYWEDSELTNEKFQPAANGCYEYLTGDSGYMRPDGSVRFVGRLDFQIKLNGIRIELGEVESILNELDDVTQAVAVITTTESSDSDSILVAYVASSSVRHASNVSVRAECEQKASDQYRAYLKRWLPDYMVPGIFIFMDELPKTPSGKVDRGRLTTPIANATTHIPPRNAIEQRLSEVWKRVMNLEFIGVQDDFFLLGGHSLKAMRLIAAIHEEFGIEISLKEFFSKPSIEGCACLIEKDRDGDGSRIELVMVEGSESERYYPFPLTLMQQAYWIGRSEAFELGNMSTQTYVEAIVSELCVERLSQAFDRLIARHDMLRAVITDSGEQKILERVPGYDIKVIDLRGRSEQEISSITEGLREEMASQLLAADTWPIFDLRVSLLPHDVGRLHIVTDSIAIDAKSRSVLANELSALYNDPELQLPSLNLSFRDYVLAEQGIRKTDAYVSARSYWLNRLDTLPGAPDLPLALTPTQSDGASVRRWYFDLDRESWSSLKIKAAQCRLTPTNVLLTAFAEVLALWSKGGHFCLNLTLFNRHRVHEQVDDIVGNFTSSILLEVDMDAEPTFARQAARIRDQLWNDMENRHFAGVEVLRELNSRRSAPLSAQMPVVFTSTVGLTDDVDGNDKPFQISDEVGASRSRTSQVFLDCQVAERNGGACIVWDGIESLFPQDMLDEMFTVFRSRVIEIANGLGPLPESQISLPQQQKEKRKAVNETKIERADTLLHQLFGDQVSNHAKKNAVIWRDGAITYAELDHLSNALARRLRTEEALINKVVAVVAEKGWEQVVAVLAVLKSGAAYLPIDPELPLQRRRLLFEQADVDIVLTQAHLEHSLEWPDRVSCICVVREELVSCNASALANLQAPSDLAYVIFTSGSTGVPKGVMIDHRGAVNTILDINRRFSVTEKDAVLALSALNFDLSVYDIFGMLAAGGTIVLPDPAYERDPLEWTKLVNSYGVTIWNSVPALAQIWIDSLDDQDPGSREKIRVVMMSGDWIPTDLPNRIQSKLPAADLYSLGGATEASIWSIVYPIAGVDPQWASIPYGKPMENQSFRVMKPDLRDCPEWVPGYLYIGGTGLAKGYWKDAQKTDASFITCPHSGERLYKTGDLGRYLPDGNIEFLGRDDNQLKVNGYRIELGDIEAVISRLPKVKTVIAAAVGARNRKQIVAYVVLEESFSKGEISQDQAAVNALNVEAREIVRAHLPSYMLPSAFVLLDEIPLTANGKVDRSALPVLDLTRDTEKQYQAPTNPVETTLCEMWQQLLQVEQVGIEDNFFDLGGDSLLASRAVGMIRSKFALGDHFKIRSFFECPTAYAVAVHVSKCLEKISLEESLRDLSAVQDEVEEGLI